MKLTHNKYASYIKIKEDLNPPLKTVELSPDVYVDYDSNGEIYGIELLGKLKVVEMTDE